MIALVLVALAYLAVGWRVGRRQAREYYLRQQAAYPRLARESRGEHLADATLLAIGCALGWPLVLVYWVVRRGVAGAVPEFRSAELEDRITEHVAEIDRLHRQIRDGGTDAR